MTTWNEITIATLKLIDGRYVIYNAKMIRVDSKPTRELAESLTQFGSENLATN